MIPDGIRLYVGGDFNCTQHGEKDRSFQPTALQHSSAALADLIQKWRLHDSVDDLLSGTMKAPQLERFHTDYHTHEYTVAGRGLASSRLDRWYTNDLAKPWVADTIVDNDGLRSDHKGVTLHLSSPTDPVRIRKPKQVFPVPLYAQEKANHVVHEELDILAEALKSTDMTAQQAAEAWDETKVRIAVGLINAKREAQRSRTNTYRKKVKRLYHRLKKATQLAKLAAAGDLPGHLHAATLAARVRELTQHIATVKREWVRSKAQRQFQKHAWREGKTTKQFFKRISCKFADNILPALRQPAGRLARDPQEKADTLADCWSTIMQGDSTPTSSVNRVCSWMRQVDGDDVAYLASADTITEEAVAKALRACKPDKACGPNRLGNDWYRAYEERLVPLLTKLYRIWYQAQVFPQSFLTADIFCLKKSGDGANPLNYRPLALPTRY